MSENVLRQAAQEASSDPAESQTPTLTHYQQIAGELLAVVTGLVPRIPHFESSHPLTKGFVRSNSNVPADFIATVLAAVEMHPELQRLGKFDVTEAHDTVQFLQAFRPLLQQLEDLTRDVKFTMDARKAKVAADALQIYYLAKGITRDPSSAALTARVERMKLDLGRSRPKQRDEQPEPVPDPTGVVAAKAA
jgi:hypothetical protein